MSEKHKSKKRGEKSMRWLLLLLVFAAIGAATALPPDAPPAPDDALPAIDYSLALTVPGAPAAVNATVTVNYSHTAPVSLNCSMYSNTTGYRNATVIQQKTEALILPNGLQYLNVTCVNASANISLSTLVSFTVVNATQGPTVTIVAPAGSTAAPLFNITYKHSGPNNGTCNTSIDGYVVDTVPTLANNTARTYTASLPADSWGVNTIAINCIGNGWAANASKDVNVSNATPLLGGLLITPSSVFLGENVTISGTFGSLKNVTIKIKRPDNTTDQRSNSSLSGNISIVYAGPKVGSYYVNATDGTKTVDGTFSVRIRTPTLSTFGNRVEIAQNTTLIIYGHEFLPNANVTLTLAGPTTMTNRTVTDEDGEFGFAYPRTLAAGVYVITAKNTNNTAVIANLTINITKSNTTPNTSPNTTPNTTVVCGDGKIGGAEECDQGSANGACPAPCSSSCKLNTCQTCGNGKVEGSESCDNGASNGACPASCSTSCTTNTCTGGGTAKCGNGKVEGTEECDDGAGNGACPSACSDSCTENACTSPKTESPSSIWKSVWLYVILGIVLIGGGGVGYLAYNGTLDFSDLQGSFERIMGKSPSYGSAHASGSYGAHGGAQIDYADEQTIKGFINGERTKGFDDLTIRGALIGKGWDKDEVDRVFDELYKSQ